MSAQTFISNNTAEFMKQFDQPDILKVKLDQIQRIVMWIERFARRQLGPETKVLEIGLGCGEVICFLAQRWQAHGLEPSPPILEYVRYKAKERDLDIDLCRGAAEDSPFAFPGEQFDVILMQSVLEHVKDYNDALKNVYEALRPGGIFVFDTTNKFCFFQGEFKFPPFCYSYLPDAWRFAIRRRLQGSDIMEHGIDFHQFIPWQLRRELSKIGFKKTVDVLELIEEGDVNPERKALMRAVKRSKLFSLLYRTFYTNIFYFCQK